MADTSEKKEPCDSLLDTEPLKQDVESLRNNKEKLISETSAKNDMLGFCLAAISSVGIILSAGCVQALRGQIPPFELLTFRFVGNLAVIALVFCWKKEVPRATGADAVYVAGWAVFNLGINFTMYACYVFLPLGIATSSFRIVAMMISLPAARLILGDRITVLKVVGIVIGSIGLLLVCKPDLFYQVTDKGNDFNNAFYNATMLTPSNVSGGTTHTATSEKPMVVGYVLAVIAAICSVTQTIIHRRKLLHVSVLVLIFWLTVSGIPTSFIISLIFEDIVSPSGFVNWLLVMGSVGGAIFYSITATLGQRYASPVIIQLAYSTQVFLSFLGQYFLLQHIFPSEKSWVEIIGAVFSIFAVTLVPSTQLLIVKCNSRSQRVVKTDHLCKK